MISKIPTLKVECDACGDVEYIELTCRGNGLWYDGDVDTTLDQDDWYIVGDTSICPICHSASMEDVA